MEVYDKVSWHYPEGKNCPSIEAAKKHFIKIMDWLSKNNLLSDDGKEVLELGIDSDFSFTSSMLTDQGNETIKKYYSKWMKTIEYHSDISTDYLDSLLNNK